jgi:hypothetical protein
MLCYYTSVHNKRRFLNISVAKFPTGMRKAIQQKIEKFAQILGNLNNTLNQL